MRKLLIGLTLFAFSSVYGEGCIEYDFGKSRVDEYGFMILRFYNHCEEGRHVRVCIENKEGEWNQYRGFVDGEKTIDLNVGKGAPDATFYWTEDNSDPCPHNN